MEKEEKDIRFVARFYRENRLDTTQAWQKLGIGKQRNNSILLYRLITIAAVTFLIAGFSWWWIRISSGSARNPAASVFTVWRQTRRNTLSV